MKHEVEFKLAASSNKSQTTSLGVVTLTGVDCFPIPNFKKYQNLYLRKTFYGQATDHWKVIDFYVSFHCLEKHPIFTFELEAHSASFNEEYLSATLIKLRVSAKTLLKKGTLVEVDFGFIPTFTSLAGEVADQPTQWEVLQLGEMHKRRLAVVMSVGHKNVQVIPVTSKPVEASEKSAFEISNSTLQRLFFYGSSGKSSWALCGVPQTVSFNRVLPPVGSGLNLDKRSRNTNYGIRLNKFERELMQNSLLHTIGSALAVENMKSDIEMLKKEIEHLTKFKDSLHQLIADIGGGCEEYIPKNC